jgi:dethiobiotin synthetase
MMGVFITGTDTDVGKTSVAAGIAWSMRKKGIDIGVMKPFATGDRKYSSQYRSVDVSMLAKAADTKDPDHELNPFFSTIPTAPYTVTMIERSKTVDLSHIYRSYLKLASKHKFMVVEGIGGIFVPLTKKKCVADFATQINLPVIIVARSRIGMVNQVLLTLRACYNYHLTVMGIIINHVSARKEPFESILIKTIQQVEDVQILATLPFLEKINPETMALNLEKNTKFNMAICPSTR